MADHSESPIWCNKTKKLFFSKEGKLCSYCPSRNEENCVDISGRASFIVTGSEENTLYVGQDDKNVLKVVWDGQSPSVVSTETLATIPSNLLQPQMRGAGADAKNRLIFNVQAEKADSVNGSTVFTLDKQRNLKEAISGLQKADDGAWKSKNKVYETDEYAKQIALYDYDVENVKLSNREVIDLSHLDVQGDARGVVIDKQNNLWIVFAGNVVQVNPSGKLLQSVQLPVTGLNCLDWGNENLDVLYVTSTKILLSDEEKEQQPDCGSIYTISKTGSSGPTADDVDI